MNRNRLLVYIVSAVLSVFFLAYVLLNLDWEILRSAFSDIHWGWLAMAFAAYLLNVLLRAMRFSSLIYSRRVKWLEIVPVSALHNILMYLLPAKTGDVAYVFLAKNRLDVSLSEGTATLLAARFYDFSIVALILAVLLPFAKSDMPAWIFRSAVIFCLLILAGTIGLLTFLKYSKAALPAATVQPAPDLKQTSRFQVLFIRLQLAWNKFILGLREIQSHGAHPRVALLTAGIWLCVYSNSYFAAQSMGLPITFYQISLISIVMIPLTLLPLQGFANIGTHEVGWTSVLVAFNYPYQTALAIAAGSHFVLLLSVLISGGLAFLGSQFVLREAKI